MSAVVGVIGAVVLTLWAMGNGGSLAPFLVVNSAALVLGGTAALVLARHGTRVFWLHLRAVFSVRRQSQLLPSDLARQLVEWSALARQDGLLSLEPVLESVQEPFLRLGLATLVDGADEDQLLRTLQQRADVCRRDQQAAAAAWRSWAEIAPALGMIGTLIGLVQMLRSMAEPSTVGPAMALALTTTLYGVGVANLLAAPIASSLTLRNDLQQAYFNRVTAGLQLLLRGSGPLAIERAVNQEASSGTANG